VRDLCGQLPLSTEQLLSGGCDNREQLATTLSFAGIPDRSALT
jgi:hypothetical protein